MIAVTGANGLLGSFIIRKLIDEKESFIALKRKGSDLSLLEDVKDKITWKDADVVDPVSLNEAMQNVTAVIHAAAMVSFNPGFARKISEVNIAGTRNVVNACLVNNVKRLVYVSSVAALGRLKGQDTIDENNKWTDSSLNSHYAESKYLGELEVFRGQEEGLSTLIINPSVILAPADWTKSSAKVFKYIWDERPFYIEGCLNYVDVRDVAQVTHKLLKSPLQSDRFIINSGSISFKEFFSAIASRFRKKTPGIRVGEFFLPILARIENLRSRIKRSEPLITRETARLAGTRFLYRNEKIKKQLNFEFKSIDETLNWCCGYYLDKVQPKK